MTSSVAHLTQPKLGERQNGDAVVIRNQGTALMLAVIDGLGHGPIAAEAAQAAVAALAAAPLEQPVLATMQSLHDQLRGTRGAAATVCIVHGRKLETCAVGNVQLSCTNATVPLVLSSGVLGHRVAKFRVCQGELSAGARIALFSDGISSRVGLDEVKHLAPDAACKLLFARHRKNDDDATLLIADLHG